ncbi:uncharacterized protein TM35_000044620 [Trypanosoma theileri]|uniref:Uncharacterized protein n=1 Tax=Trypanosoma theileri TaxID=67003 RepID=A0A1X0P5W9_9TRYP|nr:uncharacterized protein TM35_000044620 [Trypanosoma theileri]ORC92248.1 hypothetical protein TM35_000044620 [Trypanosoma theileri]
MLSTVPSLRGMVLFTTAAAVESLTSNSCTEKSTRDAKQGETTQSGQETSEEILFKAFKQELNTSPCTQHTLLSSIPVGKGRSKGQLNKYRCISLQRPANGSYSYSLYLINLDHLYDESVDLLNEAHQWWLTALKDIQRNNTHHHHHHHHHKFENSNNDGGVEMEKPEIILIVISPTEAQMRKRRRPGSMLPSLVRITSENVMENVEEMHVRLCGFPHHIHFKISREQLQCLSSFSTKDNTSTSMSEWDWLILQPKELVVSHTWCSLTFISSDFITHSIFFLEWCIPSDFVWSSPQSSADGWECDILGRLLRDITKHQHTMDSPTHVNNYNDYSYYHQQEQEQEQQYHPISKRHRLEDTEAFVDMVSHVSPETVNTTEALEYAKKVVDMRFVEMMCTRRALTPDREATVRSLLGQLRMMEETHTLHDITINNNEKTNYSFSAIMPTKQTERVKKEWEKLQQSHHYHYHHKEKQQQVPLSHLEEEEKKEKEERRIHPFLEKLQERLLHSNKRNTVCPLQFTGDAEKLLEAPRIAEEILHAPQQDAIELADVAQLRMLIKSDVNSSSYSYSSYLPCGDLRSILEASMDAYITSAADGEDEKMMKPTRFTPYKEEEKEEKEEKEVVVEEEAARENGVRLLEVMGDAILNAVNAFAGNRDNTHKESCSSVDDVIQHVWNVITEYLESDRNNDTEPFRSAEIHSKTDWIRSRLQEAISACVTIDDDNDDNNNNNNVGNTKERRNLLWLSHAAFLISHTAIPNTAIDPPPPPICRRGEVITSEEHTRRVVRAMEAHVFFLDAALCAFDSAILNRWKEAREALQQREKEKGKKKTRCV